MSTAKKTEQTNEVKYVNTSKVINEINYNGNDLPFSVSLKAVSAVEKESGEPLGDLITKYDTGRAIMMCREGIKAGLKNRKLDERVSEITDDFVIDLIEVQPELYGHVLKTYDFAWQKLHNIQAEGN